MHEVSSKPVDIGSFYRTTFRKIICNKIISELLIAILPLLYAVQQKWQEE